MNPTIHNEDTSPLLHEQWEVSNYCSPHVRVLSRLHQLSGMGEGSIPVKYNTFCDVLNNICAYLHIWICTKHPEQNSVKCPLLLHVHQRLKYVNNSEAVHPKCDPHLLILKWELQYNNVLRHRSAPKKRKVILEVLHLLATRYLSFILKSVDCEWTVWWLKHTISKLLLQVSMYSHHPYSSASGWCLFPLCIFLLY